MYNVLCLFVKQGGWIRKSEHIRIIFKQYHLQNRNRSSSNLTMLQQIQENATETLTAIVVGDARVGKTTLVGKACNANISIKTVPTIGIQFQAMSMSYKNRQYRIKFWDLSGQKKYRNLFDSYIGKCSIAVVVFDLTNYESFHNAKQWLLCTNRKYKDINQLNEQVYPILFGNKKDLQVRNKNSNTNVPKQKIAQFVQESGVIYQQGCALSDQRLVIALQRLLERNFLPNSVILEGADQAKVCGCFCNGK